MSARRSTTASTRNRRFLRFFLVGPVGETKGIGSEGLLDADTAFITLLRSACCPVRSGTVAIIGVTDEATGGGGNIGVLLLATTGGILGDDCTRND